VLPVVLCCVAPLNLCYFILFTYQFLFPAIETLVFSLLFLNMIVHFGFLGFYWKRVLRNFETLMFDIFGFPLLWLPFQPNKSKISISLLSLTRLLNSYYDLGF